MLQRVFPVCLGIRVCIRLSLRLYRSECLSLFVFVFVRLFGCLLLYLCLFVWLFVIVLMFVFFCFYMYVCFFNCLCMYACLMVCVCACNDGSCMRLCTQVHQKLKVVFLRHSLIQSSNQCTSATPTV